MFYLRLLLSSNFRFFNQ